MDLPAAVVGEEKVARRAREWEWARSARRRSGVEMVRRAAVVRLLGSDCKEERKREMWNLSRVKRSDGEEGGF